MNFRDTPRRRREHPDLELTPLIDIIFLLLIFFVVTTTFAEGEKVQEEEIPVNLPEAGSGSGGGEGQPVALTVESDGSITVQGADDLTGESVAAKLKALRESKPNARILLRADAESRHERLVDLLDQVKGAGFERVNLVTRPPSSSDSDD